jgi:mRNA-degrading endonuclease toxin of MazEF toxin-antitoxin module
MGEESPNGQGDPLIEQGSIYLLHKSGIKVLVISPAAFNRTAGIPIVALIADQPSRMAGFSVSLVGISQAGTVRCDRLYAVHLDNKTARKLGMATRATLTEVLHRVNAIFEHES